MLPGLVGLSYRGRLARLGLYSLKHRRMRGDLIEVYKIMRGINRKNTCLLPREGELKTRGHRFKVRAERFKKDLRDNFITQRVVRLWNELSEKVGEADSIATFKKHLDNYTDGKGLEGYGPNTGNWD